MIGGAILAEPEVACKWVVFPERGVASLVCHSETGRQVAVGVFGRDGMGSTAIVLGAAEAPHRIVVQVPGDGHRLAVPALRAAMARSPELKAHLLVYVQAMFVQVAQTSLANACCTIEQRLARWLLLVHDRVDGDELPVTHEVLSMILGAQRTGVTLAIHVLEGKHTVRARRGIITITDRPELQRAAGFGHGRPEAPTLNGS